MSLISYNKKIRQYPKKYKSTKDIDVLYNTTANTDGSLQYCIYKDLLFSLKFLHWYNYSSNNIIQNNNAYDFEDSYIKLNHDIKLETDFTIVVVFFLKSLYKQQILLTNNNNFQLSINPIGYNNCIVFKLGNNIIYQENVLNENKWNNVVLRCNENNIQTYVNRNIKKQPIELTDISVGNYSIGCSSNNNYESKFFLGSIKQLSIYSNYKNDSFVIRY